MTPTDPNTLDAATTPPPSNPQVDVLTEPTFEECIIEGNRFFDEVKEGRFNDCDVPEGHHIAYYDGQIRDHDADPTALRARVASALGVHPARVFIHYPWAG